MMKLKAKGRTLNIPEEDYVVIETLAEFVKQKTLLEEKAEKELLYDALTDLAKCINQKDRNFLKPETRLLIEQAFAIAGLAGAKTNGTA